MEVMKKTQIKLLQVKRTVYHMEMQKGGVNKRLDIAEEKHRESEDRILNIKNNTQIEKII
jgi:hypothetical protein